MSLKPFAAACLLMLAFTSSQAATRYWVGTFFTRWNSTANWSATSGGFPGASVPGAADAVIFDNGSFANCNINAAVSVSSITVKSGFSGTISQNGNAIAVSGNASFSAGSFAGGTANITIGGDFTLSGAAFTATSAVMECKGNMAFTSGSFTHNNGTFRANGSTSTTLSGVSPTFYKLEFVGQGNTYTLSPTGHIAVKNTLLLSGTLFYNLATGTIDVGGDIISTNTAQGCGGDALININGNGPQAFTGSTIIGAGALPKLTINKSGPLTLTNWPGVSNNFTYTAGNVNAGTSTFCFTQGTAASYTITGSVTLANIAFPVNSSLLTATIASGTTLTATGNLSLSGAGSLMLNTGAINVNGNISLTNTGTTGGGSATINITGNGTVSMNGTTLVVNQSRLPAININKSGGSLSLAGNISFASNITYTAGTVIPGTSTAYLVNNLTITGNLNLYNVDINTTGTATITIATGNTVTAANNYTMEDVASNDIVLNGGILAVKGNVIDNNTGTGGGGTGTLLFNGTGNQTITTTGGLYEGMFPAVTINKTSGILKLPTLLTARSNWTYVAGTIDAASNNSEVVFANTLTITGTHSLQNISFDGSGNYNFNISTGTTLTAARDVSITGTNDVMINTGTVRVLGDLNLTNTGTNGGGTGTVIFAGTGNQSINGSLTPYQSSLPNIIINKPTGTLMLPPLITERGNWTYTTGTIDALSNNNTVVFGNTLTITGSHSLNNIIFDGRGNYTMTIPAGNTLTAAGNMVISNTSNITLNTGTIAIAGDLYVTNTATAGGGTATIVFNGTAAQALNSSVAAGQGRLPYIKIQKAGGTLTMSGTISESRDWTYTSGAVDPTTSTVNFGGNNLNITSNGMSFANVAVSSNTSTLVNGLTVLSNLAISGTAVLAAGANTIFLYGNWTSWGAGGFTEGSSTVQFNGSGTQTIATAGGETFSSLQIKNSGTGALLTNDVTVSSVLTMVQGNINLNGNNLILGTSAANKGTLAYTTGTITGTGTFRRWFNTSTVADLSTTGLFPMGTIRAYRPFYVTAPVTAPTAGGTIAVSHADLAGNTTVSIPDGAATVKVRKNFYWAVTTGNGLAGGSYNLDAQSTLLGGLGNVADLRVTRASSVVGTAGTNGGTLASPQVNRTGLSAANLANSFYVGSMNLINSPLALQMLSFAATRQSGITKCLWTISGETGPVNFTIQRSSNSSDWTDIGELSSIDSSGLNKTFSFVDNTMLTGDIYYRLRMTDIAGQATYSQIAIVRGESRAAMPYIFPNPAKDHFQIGALPKEKAIVDIVNSSGVRVFSVQQANGSDLHSVNIAGLASGTYFVTIRWASGSTTVPLIKL